MRDNKGFTIMELLLVVLIVGLLASLVLVSIQQIRIRIKADKMASDFRQMELAFNAWMEAENRDTWYHTGNPETTIYSATVSHLVASTNLKYFLAVAPKFDGMDYLYTNHPGIFDSDGDGCAGVIGDIYRGVSFNIVPAASIALMVDQIIDGSVNPNCGKLAIYIKTTYTVHYILSNDYHIRAY